MLRMHLPISFSSLYSGTMTEIFTSTRAMGLAGFDRISAISFCSAELRPMQRVPIKKEGPDDRSGLFTHAPENWRINGVRLTELPSPPSHQYWGHRQRKFLNLIWVWLTFRGTT